MTRPQSPCGSRKRFALRLLLCSCFVWVSDSLPVLRSETSPVRNGRGQELERGAPGTRTASASTARPRRLPPVTNRPPASDRSPLSGSDRPGGEHGAVQVNPSSFPSPQDRLVSTPTDVTRLAFPSAPVKGFEMPAPSAPSLPEPQPLLLPSLPQAELSEPMTRLYPPTPKLIPIPTGHEVSIPMIGDQKDESVSEPEPSGLRRRWQGSYLRDPLRRFPLRLPRP